MGRADTNVQVRVKKPWTIGECDYSEVCYINKATVREQATACIYNTQGVRRCDWLARRQFQGAVCSSAVKYSVI
jgi:hypothetical protein